MFENDATGGSEISIEPGAPQAAAVDGHADLMEAGAGQLGAGFDAQTRAIGVPHYHREATARLVLAADCKGDDGGFVARHEVLVFRLQLPCLALLQFAETRRQQQLRALVDR